MGIVQQKKKQDEKSISSNARSRVGHDDGGL